MTADPNIIAALVTNPAALTAYLAACEGMSEPTTAAPTMPAPAKPTRSRKVKPATAKPTPTTKARAPKEAPAVWTVRASWAGVEASPRMVSSALYYGLPLTTCSKLRSDKLKLATAIGTHRGIRVVVEP